MTEQRKILDYTNFDWAEGRSLPLHDVPAEPIDWLWEGFIPRGMVSILSGEEGLGKSQLAVKIAAMYSNDRWETPGVVKYYTAEDSLRHTVRPRFDAAGANIRQVYADALDVETYFTEEGFSHIEREIVEIGYGFVVIDPIISYLGSRQNANNAQHVRRVMRLWASICERHGTTVLGIMHPKKGEEAISLHKMLGTSSAWGQAARSVLAVVRHPEEEKKTWRLVGNLKANMSAEPDPVQFEIVPDERYAGHASEGKLIKSSKAEYRGALVDFNFRRYVYGGAQPSATFDGPPEPSPRDRAEAFLEGERGDGWVPAAPIQRRARVANIAARTLTRARNEAGIETKQEGGRWFWMWPEE